MKKKLFFILFSFFALVLSLNSYGQANDKIYLKNKEIIEGKILKVTEYNIEIDPVGERPFLIVKREDATIIIYADNTVVKLSNDEENKETVNDEDKEKIKDEIKDEIKKSIIIQEKKSDPTLNFLKRKYEKNYAIAKFGGGMTVVGLSGLGLSLVGIISQRNSENYNGTLWSTITTGSGLLILSGIVVARIAGTRADHFNGRIQELSFTVIPNQTMYADNKLNFSDLCIGIRITF